MPAARNFPRMRPEAYPQGLQEFEGKWVALRGSEVVAAAESSGAVVAELRERGIKGATIQFVAPVTRQTKVGLG